MADLARFVQDHPYQAVYLALMVLGFVMMNEVRHALDKRRLRRAWAPTPAAAPPPMSAAHARPTASGWGTVVTVVIGLSLLAFTAPIWQGQASSALSSPMSTLLTTGTYRGLGTGTVGNMDLTLTLDGSSGTPRVRLSTPRLGTFDFQGSLTPESGGMYLSGPLMRGGTTWGTLQAHVSALAVMGRVSAGPFQWTLDLRR